MYVSESTHIRLTGRHYRITEFDAAQRYAQRLSEKLRAPVRVIRGHGEVVVQVVEDERSTATPHNPDRRASSR